MDQLSGISHCGSRITGRYRKHHEPGTYHCVCCSAPLFRSQEKLDSGTGWPGFWAPAAQENVAAASDHRLFMRGTEVLCGKCDAHPGHVFDDGPEPTARRAAASIQRPCGLFPNNG
jgi:peptide-methionine (R)-S-oxide reductase